MPLFPAKTYFCCPRYHNTKINFGKASPQFPKDSSSFPQASPHLAYIESYLQIVRYKKCWEP